LTQLGGLVGALGLAVLVAGPNRTWRLGGLAGWALGCVALAAHLAPHGHHRVLAAAAVVGIAAAIGLAWAFVRVPWLLPVAVLACAPARFPVHIGNSATASGNLLLPMYLVVAAAACALLWELFGDDPRSRELGPLTWPVAAFVAWNGLAYLWTMDVTEGAKYLLFYFLPFGLLAVSLARLPWLVGGVQTIAVQLGLMGVVFALIGIVQYLTRNIYWNPKVKVDNAYAPSSWFYRVNSVFYDPSIYGRFLVVAILTMLVVFFLARRWLRWIALVVAVVTWIGLVFSFSQSSFVALGVGLVVAVGVVWGRRSLVPIAVVLVVAAVAGLAVPQVRHRVLGKATSSRATDGRSKLVKNGIRLALHHPLGGVGTGGFKRGYANLTHLRGKNPKAAASHDTPITVAAELGLPGLALFIWLVVVAFGVPFRIATRAGPVVTRGASFAFGLALVAIVTHSLSYNSLFEDPLFWGAFALAAVAARQAVRE
jgi:putative inorganic carbon (HCO3(-)) transporter